MELRAPLSGWLRGLAHDGARVEPGNKIVEVDPLGTTPRRGLGERPRRIAEGVLQAIEQRRQPSNRARGRAGPFGAGAAVATLGGLIGLGGAEFRLPLLAGPFKLPTRDAILVNMMVSLVTVVAAFGFRLASQGAASAAVYWPQALNLALGTLVGAWVGGRMAATLRFAS